MGVLTLREEDQKSLQVPDPWSSKAFPGVSLRGMAKAFFGSSSDAVSVGTIYQP